MAAPIVTGDHLFMPFVAFAAVGVLALVLRWSQTPRRSRRAQQASPRGLLVPIASFPTQAAADELAGHLRRGGIRAASAPSVRGIDVLVWQEEYGEARMRIGGGTPD